MPKSTAGRAVRIYNRVLELLLLQRELYRSTEGLGALKHAPVRATNATNVFKHPTIQQGTNTQISNLGGGVTPHHLDSYNTLFNINSWTMPSHAKVLELLNPFSTPKLLQR